MRRFLSFTALFATVAIAGCGGANSPTALPSDLHGGSARADIIPQAVQTGKAPLNWEHFAVQPPSGNPPPSDFRGIVKGPDNNMWFADRQSVSIDRVTMGGTVTKFPLPIQNEAPWGITSGPDGAVWFTTTGSHIGRVTTAGSVTEYQVTCGTYDGSIHGGPDGNVWFPDCAGNVERITPTGKITVFPVHGDLLKGMAVGKDNNLWFSDITAQGIVRMTTAGALTTFHIHNLGANAPTEVAEGPDGTIWFAECNASEFGKITTSGSVSYYPTPLCLGEPNSLVLGPDGAMWAAHANVNTGVPSIERITSSGAATFYALPGNVTSNTADIAAGPDGNLWFTGGYNYAVGVYIRDVLTVSPSSVAFKSIGQTSSITISEANYSGPWTVVSSNPKVATATATTKKNLFTVKANGAGSVNLTVSDSIGNSFNVPVTVP